MNYKSKKLKELERKRFSILTDNLQCCWLCGERPVDIHEIYGGSNRQTSMKHGFCVPLCRNHHIEITNNNESNKWLKQICQIKFEMNNNRESFIKIIGKNYLGD